MKDSFLKDFAFYGTRTRTRVLLMILLLGVAVPLVFGCSQEESRAALDAKKGTVNLEGVSLKEQTFALNGQWAFYPEQLIDPASVSTGAPHSYRTLPGEWNDYEQAGGEIRGSNGYGTYTLRLHGLPEDTPVAISTREQGTSYRIFFCESGMPADRCRQPVISNGTPGESQAETIPHLLPAHNEFSSHTGSGTLVMHVANFHHRQGGPWEVIYLGHPSLITGNLETSKAMAYVSLGIILIMGLYHLGLYAQRREDRGALFFGLFCLDLTLRILVTERIFHSLVPEPSVFAFEWLYKLEYLTFFFGTAFFGQFFYEVFRAHIHRFFVYALWIVTAVFGAQLVLDVSFYSQTIIGFQVFTLLISMYAIFVLINSLRHRVAGSAISLISLMILFGSVINDILYSRGTIHTAYILPYGFLFFIFSQSLILSVRFSLAYRESEAFRTSMARFVPSQFVQFLGKRSILDVQAGEGLEKSLTVLFLDIRGFTTISEAMSPQDNFVFLNNFLKRMNPHIHSNGGFVDKFIGDAIMALFPENGPVAAVQAAVAMHRELESYNNEREIAGLPRMGMGIGIHTGDLMLGTVGTIDRLDTTVIGDTVNLAARLETLTRTYNSPIIVSEATVRQLPENQFHIRQIDRVQVKGKQTLVDIYEVYDSDANEILQAKDKTRGTLRQALELMKLGRYEESVDWLDQCLTAHPDDGACQVIRQRALRNTRSGHSVPTGEKNTGTQSLPNDRSDTTTELI